MAPRASARTPDKSGEVLPFPEIDLTILNGWREEAKALTHAVDKHATILEETNGHLKTLAEGSNTIVRTLTKWVPWIIAGASVLWPTVGKIVDQVTRAANIG